MDSFNRDMPGGEPNAGADPSQDSDASKRTRTRDSLFLIAQLRVGDDPKIHEVRVRNLSEGGLMVELDRVVAADTPVRLDVRGIGDIAGRVAWCTEGRLGIALNEPIDPKKARKPVGMGKPVPFYAKPAPRR